MNRFGAVWKRASRGFRLIALAGLIWNFTSISQGASGGDDIPSLCNPPGLPATVTRPRGAFDASVGQTISISVDMTSFSGLSGRVWIENSIQQLVKVLFEGAVPGSAINTSWDGKDQSQTTRREGIYLIKAGTWDEGSASWVLKGQCDAIIFRPVWGVSQFHADKYKDSNSKEIRASGDDWTASGISNPLDGVAAAFDGNALGMAYLNPDGVFRTEPFPYTPGAHTISVTVTPYEGGNAYTSAQGIWLNKVTISDACPVNNGTCVRTDNFFFPANGERFKVSFALDASEANMLLGIYMKYTDPSQQIPEEAIVKPLGALSAGANVVEWDGTDQNGNALAAGVYGVYITAKPDPKAQIMAPTMPYTRVWAEIR